MAEHCLRQQSSHLLCTLEPPWELCEFLLFPTPPSTTSSHLEALSRYIAGPENLGRVWCKCSLNHTLRRTGLLNTIPTPDTFQVPKYWTAFPQHASLVQNPSLIPRVLMLHGLLRLLRHVVCVLLSPFSPEEGNTPFLVCPLRPLYAAGFDFYQISPFSHQVSSPWQPWPCVNY